MKQNHLTIYVRPWKGMHQVPTEEAEALYVPAIALNGVEYADRPVRVRQVLSSGAGRMRGFGAHAVSPPELTISVGGFLTLTVRNPPSELLEQYEPADFVRGTSYQELILPLHGLRTEEYTGREDLG